MGRNTEVVEAYILKEQKNRRPLWPKRSIK